MYPLRARVLSVGFVIALIAGLGGCPDFASGQCTDRALCAAGADGAVPDGTIMGDHDGATSDVTSDSNLLDGPPADGNCCLTVPSGWAGPVAVWAETSGSAPNCAGDYAGAATDYNAGLSAAAATCSTCGCGTPTGESCNATIQVYTDGNCADTCGSTFTVSNMNCVDYGPCNVDGSTQSATSSSSITAGTCTPSGGTPTVPAATWTTSARTCAYSATTSACAGGTCYGAPSSPFVGPCVTQAGANLTCPTGFPNQNVFYGGINDTRGCAACGCDPSTGGACNGYMQFWHGSGCSMFPVTSGLLPNVSCADTYTSAYVGGSVKGGFNVIGGTCTATGGGAQGSASPSDPITICCE